MSKANGGTIIKTKRQRKQPRLLRMITDWLISFWNRGWWQRTIAIIVAILILVTSSMFGIGQYYINRHAHEPTQIGATFIPSYASFYGLDPKETLHAILTDLNIRSLRLVSYWDEIEKSPGVYDFSGLDWQFQMAEESGATISLALGIRQPRWPECHPPKWVNENNTSEWAPQLKTFMGKVIERYKTSPALVSYQLENEFFMSVFGTCTDFTRERLIDEYNYVKQQDPSHPIIVSRSNNWIGIPINEPEPDQFGISVYKRVWDKTFTKRYFEYPLPPWFYAFLAGAGEIATGKSMIIHELQAEPWLPDGFEINNINSIPEQNKSMNAARLKDRIAYAEATGMKRIDLWGVEWWYWRKVKANDPSLWNTASQEIARIHAQQNELLHE